MPANHATRVYDADHGMRGHVLPCGHAYAASITTKSQRTNRLPNVMSHRTYALSVATLILAATLSSPSRAQRAALTYDTELSRNAKVLGVVIASGYQAHVTVMGTLLPASSLFTVAREDNLLSDNLYKLVKAELELEQRYDFKRLLIAPATARLVVNSLWDRQTDRYKTLASELQEVYRGCECDAVLLLADGPSHNTFVEAGFTHGLTWAGKTSFFGGSGSAHTRIGLLALLIDPRSGKRVSIGGADQRPDYVQASPLNWPGAQGPVADQHWMQMASYLSSVQPVVRKALHEAGVRPSCALPSFEKLHSTAVRDLEPPQTLPGSDPARCQ